MDQNLFTSMAKQQSSKEASIQPSANSTITNLDPYQQYKSLEEKMQTVHSHMKAKKEKMRSQYFKQKKKEKSKIKSEFFKKCYSMVRHQT
jgi:lysyl-tRNA synthetase class I